jgi:hypothetical protein
MIKINKKAWVAVTEAVLGIVILFTFVMIVLGNQQKQQENTFDFNALFIKEIETNQDLRNYILAEKIDNVNYTLQEFFSKFNNNYNLDVCVNNFQESCSSGIKDKEVIAIDYFVAANSGGYGPKKLRIFLWRKE